MVDDTMAVTMAVQNRVTTHVIAIVAVDSLDEQLTSNKTQ